MPAPYPTPLARKHYQLQTPRPHPPHARLPIGVRSLCLRAQRTHGPRTPPCPCSCSLHLNDRRSGSLRRRVNAGAFLSRRGVFFLGSSGSM
ncbi:hypothetical protein OF83DRAFT_1159860 [Amylostereum chailletii]|nr:hypothetical protein OF83DRAFT_1159860 [Amylostereum chailletii]